MAIILHLFISIYDSLDLHICAVHNKREQCSQHILVFFTTQKERHPPFSVSLCEELSDQELQTFCRHVILIKNVRTFYRLYASEELLSNYFNKSLKAKYLKVKDV